MDAIIAINATYIETKGKTFFANQLMLDNPLTSDEFINDTLEHLRQTARIGVTRGDEQQIEQTLRVMASLVRAYIAIDYANPHASKTHAHLAAGYLTGEVERIVPHNMPDVLMEGVRLMGQCADMLLATEGPQSIATMVQKIGLISCAGVAREDYRPVTSTGVEQLTRLSFELLRTNKREVQFAAQDIRETVKLFTDDDIVEQAFELRRHARVNQGRISLLENSKQTQSGFGGHNVLSLNNQKPLPFQPSDDLGAGRRGADALGFLQPVPQSLVLDKAPSLLHRFDQSTFVVARGRPGFLALDGRIP
jgi:hypothetical protein